jgi:hypothetical protein
MTAPAARPPVFRIIGSRAPFSGRGKRAKWLWACTGLNHTSWLVTMTNGKTLGPFDDLRDAQARL